MAFENAIITKEDDKKYKLTKIFLKYNPYDKGLPDQWYWVIDRERDCWLMKTGFFPDPEVDHGYLTKDLWTLYYKGDIVEVILDIELDEEKEIINSIKYDTVWYLLELHPRRTWKLKTQDIIDLLAEALDVFGLNGAWDQAPNFKVKLISKLKG